MSRSSRPLFFFLALAILLAGVAGFTRWALAVERQHSARVLEAVSAAAAKPVVDKVHPPADGP